MKLRFPDARRGALLRGTAAAVIAAAAVSAWALVPDGGPRPVTGDEARRLALARFGMYERSPVPVVVRAPMGDGTIEVEAVVDYREHRAVGTYRIVPSGGRADGGSAGGLVAWDASGLALAGTGRGASGAAAAVRAVRELGPGAWSPRRYTADPFDLALRLVMNMGADRPENAQLLAQNGAMWLRNEDLEGREFGVFSGPRPAAARAASTTSPVSDTPPVSAASPATAGGGAVASPAVVGSVPAGSGVPAGGAPSRAGRPATGRSPLTYWVDADGTLRQVEVRPAGQAVPSVIEAGRTASRLAVPDTPWQRRGSQR
ncbi:hypothetical protein [Streptomyces sp. NPDC097619]|uniref:hypothetical protein n=1 Tax=Streptomyces sp. NPDC097619 TaxID=3157228 RepID=UPI00332BE331